MVLVVLLRGAVDGSSDRGRVVGDGRHPGDGQHDRRRRRDGLPDQGPGEGRPAHHDDADGADSRAAAALVLVGGGALAVGKVKGHFRSAPDYSGSGTGRAVVQVKPGDSVLEVGAGSGYAAAVMGQVADRVYAIERHPSLGEAA